MAHHRIHAHAHSAAPRATVWKLLADAESYSDWGIWDEAGLDREGVPTRDGVGAIRPFRVGGRFTVEQVVGFEAPVRLAYHLLSGVPVKDYRGEVTLSEAADGGADIDWRSEFDGVWFVGALVRRKLAGIIADVAGRLARAAETEAPGRQSARANGSRPESGG